jgi:hypothetical protein
VNGWQRLWVVAVALWGCAVATMAYAALPPASAYVSIGPDVVEERLLARLRRDTETHVPLANRFKVVRSDVGIDDINAVPPFLDGPFTFHATDTSTGGEFTVYSPYVPSEGELLEAEIENIERELRDEQPILNFDQKLVANARAERRTIIESSVLAWIIPTAGIYALGWSIGRIRRSVWQTH